MNQGMQHYFIQMQLSGLATTASHYSSGVSKYICTAKKIKNQNACVQEGTRNVRRRFDEMTATRMSKTMHISGGNQLLNDTIV